MKDPCSSLEFCHTPNEPEFSEPLVLSLTPRRPPSLPMCWSPLSYLPCFSITGGEDVRLVFFAVLWSLRKPDDDWLWSDLTDHTCCHCPSETVTRDRERERESTEAAAAAVGGGGVLCPAGISSSDQ